MIENLAFYFIILTGIYILIPILLDKDLKNV